MSLSESAKSHCWPIIYLLLDHSDHRVVRKGYMPMRVFSSGLCSVTSYSSKFFILIWLNPGTQSLSLGTAFQRKVSFRAFVIF